MLFKTEEIDAQTVHLKKNKVHIFPHAHMQMLSLTHTRTHTHTDKVWASHRDRSSSPDSCSREKKKGEREPLQSICYMLSLIGTYCSVKLHVHTT